MEGPAEVMTRSHSSPRIADTPAGFAQLARRLAEQPDWSPARTLAFANLADPDRVALAGPAS